MYGSALAAAGPAEQQFWADDAAMGRFLQLFKSWFSHLHAGEKLGNLLLSESAD